MMAPYENDQLNKVIEGCANGDRKCQQIIYQKLYEKMYSICIRYSKDKDDALDILQDGFIKVFTNIKLFGSLGSFEGWVRKIIVNTAIDFYRKKKQSVVYSNTTYVETNAEDLTEEDENDAEYSNITSEEIMEAVQKLPPAYRTVFNMFVMDGFSHKEIAEQLGIAEGTSKSNLAKAKINLKKSLASKIKILQ